MISDDGRAQLLRGVSTHDGARRNAKPHDDACDDEATKKQNAATFVTPVLLLVIIFLLFRFSLVMFQNERTTREYSVISQ